jgi:transcription antitermination factor NusG
MSTLSNVTSRRGETKTNPPSVGISSDAIPEADSLQIGVSVDYVHDASKKWYVFRASYGRDERAREYMENDGATVYIAQRYVVKYVNGKRKKILENLVPNILFAYITDEKANEYVKETPELDFLTYYYNHFELNDEKKNPPLTISVKEMDNFIRATCNRNEHLLFVQSSQCHYKSGETVKIVDGVFKGVEGKVARVAGQQRVIVTLSQVGLISTAYIPTAFIEKLGTEE